MRPLYVLLKDTSERNKYFIATKQDKMTEACLLFICNGLVSAMVIYLFASCFCFINWSVSPRTHPCLHHVSTSDSYLSSDHRLAYSSVTINTSYVENQQLLRCPVLLSNYLVKNKAYYYPSEYTY